MSEETNPTDNKDENPDHVVDHNIETPDAPQTGMLPPMRLALFLVAGIVLNFLVPISLGRAWGWAGLILVVIAVWVGKWAIEAFKTAGTNVPPNQPAIIIVDSGPYKYSRNPMYLSMVLLYAGAAIMMDAPLMLLLLTPGLWFVLDQQVIRKEEAYLTEKFGELYTSYQERVRRWI